MRVLNEKQTLKLYTEMVLASESGIAVYREWRNRIGCKPALIEFPTGELAQEYTAEQIGGFLWAWQQKGLIISANIEKSDRFRANGLGQGEHS